jgi:hypothetical protein
MLVWDSYDPIRSDHLPVITAVLPSRENMLGRESAMIMAMVKAMRRLLQRHDMLGVAPKIDQRRQ